MSRKITNPYTGEQARGWEAYHVGIPRESNPFRDNGNQGHAQRWDEGWRKAKLAKEQGKRAV